MNEQSDSHNLGKGCWCAPIIAHVSPEGKIVVDTVRDADRLAELGVTHNVVVRPGPPSIPNQGC